MLSKIAFLIRANLDITQFSLCNHTMPDRILFVFCQKFSVRQNTFSLGFREPLPKSPFSTYALRIIIRLFSHKRGITTDINIEVRIPEGGGNVTLGSCQPMVSSSILLRKSPKMLRNLYEFLHKYCCPYCVTFCK